jgi:hypothetical protein
MSTQLVTYAQAKEELRLPDDREQVSVERKTQQATAFVLSYIYRRENDWTTATDPAADSDFAIVQGAILFLLGTYWRKRGDDTDLKLEDPAWGAYLEAPLRRTLHLLRRPTLA